MMKVNPRNGTPSLNRAFAIAAVATIENRTRQQILHIFVM